MKYLFLLLFIISCKPYEITTKPLANQLVGTTWVTHLGTGIEDKLEYIRVLKFSSESDLYFMDYNSNGLILSPPDKYKFTRTSTKIEATNGSYTLKGYKDGNILKLGAYEYFYIDIEGSISEYLKKYKY